MTHGQIHENGLAKSHAKAKAKSQFVKGCSRNYPGGGPQALFCPVACGGGCFVGNVSEGWGVTCPGGQGVFGP